MSTIKTCSKKNAASSTSPSPAKDELYLTYHMMNPKSYTGDVICRPSQFLEDFPQELVEEWNVGNSDPWSDDEPF